jgi:hypothetical protein
MNGIYNEYKITTFDSIKCDEDKIEEVSDMYEKLAKTIFDEKIIDDGSFEDAYNHMLTIEKLLYSKKGIKKAFVNFLFKKTPFNTMMHPLKVRDENKIDYLNTKKNEWKDPSSEISTNKSFNELLEEAKAEAIVWISLVNDAYEGKNIDLDGFTNNYIYDGYKEGEKMKVFNSVYKKGK